MAYRLKPEEQSAEAKRNDLIKLLGFDSRKLDPALLAEAYEITAFIATEVETLNLLKTFAQEYAGAQVHPRMDGWTGWMRPPRKRWPKAGRTPR